MSVSSGMTGLFAIAGFCIVAAGGTAYGLKHGDEIRSIVSGMTGIQPGPAPGAKISDKAVRAATDEPESESAAVGPAGDVTLQAGGSGHFETTAEINGRSVDVLVDTGATVVALTYEDAERAGIYPKPSDFTYSVSTANGIAKVAPVDIGAISVGNITVHNVRGAVTERGKMNRTLLGMTFLGRLHVEMRKNELVLRD